MASPEFELRDVEVPLIAIGDIHGRLDLLKKLIRKIEKQFRNRPFKAVFLGDYIDRGAESRGVLDELIEFGARYPETIFLKGNHEEAMLDFLAVGEEADGWIFWGGEETLQSYEINITQNTDLNLAQEQLASVLPERHFNFLMSLKLMHEEQGYVFVHAGLDPKRPLTDQRQRDLLWIREAFIENAEGQFPNHVIVHGHTPVKRPDNLSWRINVDTGAVWSGRLSAVVLDNGKRSFIHT